MSFNVVFPDINFANAVLVALSKAPISWEIADPLIQNIKAQVGAQLAAQEKEANASKVAGEESKPDEPAPVAEDSSV